MSYILGIDLGTTYSAMAYINADGKSEIIPNAEGERITPSVVLFEDDGVVVIGSYAKSVAVSQSEQVVQFIKRHIGFDYRVRQNGNDYTPEEISALILKKMKQDAEAFLNTTIRDAVITVPAYFDEKRRVATKIAGEIAGLNVRRIVNEPTAAALEFSASQKINNKTILVYDFGGGTFDVTIMKVHENAIDVIASGGDHELGGKDVDDCLIAFFQEEFQKSTGVNPLTSLAGQQELRSKAEEAKRKLSISPNARIALNVEGRQANFKVTQSIFEELIDELVLRTEMNVEVVLDEAGLSRHDIDDVLLVGGSTRIPQIAKMLTQLFGKAPLKSVNPDEAVAQGAAILAHKLSIELAEPSSTSNDTHPIISDVCAHSLGVSCLNDFGIPENSIIISKNTKLPCYKSQVYGTAHDNQTAVSIEVLQGDHKEPEECVQLGTVRLENFPKSPAGSPIEVVFEYDENGLLQVKGLFANTGQSISTKIEVEGTMTPEAAQRSRQSMASMSVE